MRRANSSRYRRLGQFSATQQSDVAMILRGVSRVFRLRPRRRQNQPTCQPPGEPIRDMLRRRQDFVKWTLVVLIATLVLVVVGEVLVSRKSASRPATTTTEGAKPVTIGAATDIRDSKGSSRHIQTWRGEGGNGLEVQLVSAISRSDEMEVTFLVRTGDHSSLLLYEPPGDSGQTRTILGKQVRVDRDFGELYVEDNTGAKYVSTSGFVGGQQTNFNLYNFTRRINFKPHEEVVLSVKFPAIARHASSVTFVSPGLGKWQPEWRWPAISLKLAIFSSVSSRYFPRRTGRRGTLRCHAFYTDVCGSIFSDALSAASWEQPS